MKTSVYIPDELWDKVQGAEPGASPSQLLQQCLRSRFEQSAPVFAPVDSTTTQRQDLIVATLRDRFQVTYQEGYSLGLDLLEGLPAVDLLWLLASVDFKLDDFTARCGGEPAPFDFEAYWASAVGRHPHLADASDPTLLPRVAAKGMLDAMRSTWRHVAGEWDATDLVSNPYMVGLWSADAKEAAEHA